jgi:hypothetical protein|tara:strand:- start:252 stop:461 length:210 start_codon:yes stop_codon:yes gene_type:complete
MSVNKVPERIFNLPITVARRMPDRTIQDTGPMIDMRAMRSYRLSRVKDQLKRQDKVKSQAVVSVSLHWR